MVKRLVGLLLIVVVALGCGDRMVQLKYQAPPTRDVAGPALIVLPAIDRRGDEGDAGNPVRVGGIYGGYGNRVAKVVLAQPWPPALQSALVAEFRAQGVAADVPPASRPAPTIEPEIRNFSTETRWTVQAHIGAILRVRAADGRLVLEKKIEVRESGTNTTTETQDAMEANLNVAFDRFVKAVAADLDIRAQVR